MSVTLTQEQRAAIEARGQIIVSASAGSGKTFVMIERLVALVLGGADVRSILAVTFTNKAAEQMRDRLRLALIKGISEREGVEKERLKAQLAALPLAEISTIHAFCGRLIRTYFYAAGVDPAFRIVDGDDADGKALQARALDTVLEQAYEEKSPAFSLLLSVYFRKKKDAALRKTVTDLVKKMRERAGYERALADMGASDDFDALCAYLTQEYRSRADMVARGLREREHVYAGMGEKIAGYSDWLASVCACIAQQPDLFAMRENVPPKGQRPRRTSKTKVSAEEREALDFQAAAKAEADSLFEELEKYTDRETERARYLQANTVAQALGRLALAYDAAYMQEKREAGVLDYNDLEQIALHLLEDDVVRADLARKYRAVFVDEYQDVNPVQEAILARLGCGEVFLVGDAKQAIYGFRGSRSEFFEEKERSLPGSLRLSSNFRSAPAVLEAVNFVFSSLLPEYVPMRGGERYKEHAGEVRYYYLPKQKSRGKKARTIYSVLNGTGAEKEDARADKVVRIIESELGSEWFDADAQTVRRVRFSDIAVLTRRNEGEAADIARALLARGIPFRAAAEVNICDFFEVRLLLDWLSYLDNGEQDIPYCSALLSAVGGLTERDLAQVRLYCSGRGSQARMSFRAACAAFERERPDDPVARKLAAFRARAEELRVHACFRTAAQVMNELLALGLEAQIAAKEGGRTRLARVRRLVAEGEGADVNTFLAHLRASDYTLKYTESGGEDAVQIVTMHSSKGLEYPVVILAGADVAFKGEDEKHEVMFADLPLESGMRAAAATRAFDPENKISCSTVLRRACLVSAAAASRKEERNLLYVGMTRAKYRLHIVFCEQANRAIAPSRAVRQSDFFDFSACARWFVPEQAAEAMAPARRSLVHRPDAALRDAVLSVYEQPYPFEASTRIPVKSSATALLLKQVQQAEDERRFSFLDEDEPFTGGTSKEAGIAYHAFLQYMTYGKDVRGELARMVREGLLTSGQAALLDADHLERILALPCLSALAGKRCLREQSFLVRLQADEMLETDAADDVVFQGAVDLLVQDDDGYTVIDYKYSVLSDEALKEKYAVQIRLYRKAVARVLRIDENTVRARIVNIARCREIAM